MKRLICILVLCLALTGCTFYTGDELLLAPQPTKNYVALQAQLNKLIERGAVYAVPQAGRNRNTVQLVDLTGDGVDEVVAFFRDSSTASTFTVYVFQKREDAYVLADQLEGHGLSIQSVDYPRLRPSGEKGLLVAFSLEDGQTSELTLCDFTAEGMIVPLVSTDFFSYHLSDLTGDGADELFTLSIDGPSGRTAALYTYEEGALRTLGTASVSREAMTVARLSTGYLEGSVPAVFVEERPDSGVGLMTDIFVYSEGRLRNLAQSDAGTQSGFRPMSVYVSDIDGDHITEVPHAVLMRGYRDAGAADALFLLDWYAYDANGVSELKRTTYHSVAEEWTLQLPESWRRHVTAARTAKGSVSETTFYEYHEGGGRTELFTILCRSGTPDGTDDLIPLDQTGAVYYAARISEEASDSPLALDERELQSRFSLLTADWTIG